MNPFDSYLSVAAILLQFVYYYPLFMAYMWMTGALHYWFHYELEHSNPEFPPELDEYPKIALVVPCYNEGENARETIDWLSRQNYPNFEIIAVNDGSKDNTGQILDELTSRYPQLRVIHLATNQGKAMGLTTAAMSTNAQFLVCIDGDSLLDENAARWMIRHFLKSPRVGAVTGNPRIRNRSTLLGKIQVGEFSSIIGLIKRAQRTYGRLYTVSGVLAAFRKSALHDIGYWSPDMLTEDIDVSWKLQSRFWDIRFEPAALVWVLMPETIAGLWKQRLRWAMGGIQMLFKFRSLLFSWRNRRLWPLYLEAVLSLFWAYCMLTSFLLWGLSNFVKLPDQLAVSIIPGVAGAILAGTNLLQIWISLSMDARYDFNLKRHYFVTIWYPFVYWLLTACTAVVALPKVIARKKGARATWVSPDRGLVPEQPES